MDSKTIAMFVKYGVFTERELRSRYEVYQHTYDKTVEIEAGVALSMAKTMVLPSALSYLGKIADSVKSIKAVGGKTGEIKKLTAVVSVELEKLQKSISKLESAIRKEDADAQLAGMLDVRHSVDALEALVPDEIWPLPSYAEMLFMY